MAESISALVAGTPAAVVGVAGQKAASAEDVEGIVGYKQTPDGVLVPVYGSSPAKVKGGGPVLPVKVAGRGAVGDPPPAPRASRRLVLPGAAVVGAVAAVVVPLSVKIKSGEDVLIEHFATLAAAVSPNADTDAWSDPKDDPDGFVGDLASAEGVTAESLNQLLQSNGLPPGANRVKKAKIYQLLKHIAGA